MDHSDSELSSESLDLIYNHVSPSDFKKGKFGLKAKKFKVFRAILGENTVGVLLEWSMKFPIP
jgi:hypothetical protein